VGISAVSQQSRDRAETLLPGVPILDVTHIIERSELVLLAVPDDQLADLVAGLAEAGAWQAGQIVVHTSPRFGLDVLSPARSMGAIPVAIHPAMSFTGTSVDVARLAECCMAVTAPSPVLPIGQALVVEMGAEPVVIADEDRERYAEAVVTASTFSLAIVNQARALLEQAGVEDPSRVLGPVIRSTIDNALMTNVKAGDVDV
jgi:predicted short-subunit dehydrogenase-like oxidoreductase (DUF2520 family)